ncbi:hypothetical protein [Roseivirga sp.]|uniref:hypothetical protein n=1 Tax=Roseivirga sp. TaxID=1964215 RepID=UPI003B8D6EC2
MTTPNSHTKPGTDYIEIFRLPIDQAFKIKGAMKSGDNSLTTTVSGSTNEVIEHDQVDFWMDFGPIENNTEI